MILFKIKKICKNIIGYKKNSSVPKKISPKKTSPSGRKKKPVEDLVPCKPHQYRDPINRRCKNLPGYNKNTTNKEEFIGRMIPREPVPITVNSQRWERVAEIATNCALRSKTKLTDSQLKVAEFMENNSGLLVVHATGLGKTLTAITCSQCYLDKYPDNGVVFVGPPSTCSNFEKWHYLVIMQYN